MHSADLLLFTPQFAPDLSGAALHGPFLRGLEAEMLDAYSLATFSGFPANNPFGHSEE